MAVQTIASRRQLVEATRAAFSVVVALTRSAGGGTNGSRCGGRSLDVTSVRVHGHLNADLGDAAVVVVVAALGQLTGGTGLFPQCAGRVVLVGAAGTSDAKGGSPVRVGASDLSHPLLGALGRHGRLRSMQLDVLADGASLFGRGRGLSGELLAAIIFGPVGGILGTLLARAHVVEVGTGMRGLTKLAGSKGGTETIRLGGVEAVVERGRGEPVWVGGDGAEAIGPRGYAGNAASSGSGAGVVMTPSRARRDGWRGLHRGC